MKNILCFCLLIAWAIRAPLPAFSQEITDLGGDLSSKEVPAIALQVPAPNVISEERFDAVLEGHAIFHTPFDEQNPESPPVVGPLFNSNNCGECHFSNGKGAIKFAPKGFGSTILVKVSLKGLNPDGSTKDIPGTPEQIQDHQVEGKSPYSLKLRYTYVKGKYPDGTKYELRKPFLTFVIPGVDNKKVVSSLRMSPSIIGMGLLEAVPPLTLLSMSDPLDMNKDGITGKVNIVNDHRSNTREYGRFGFKASHPSILQQTAAALFHDMGVTSSLFNNGDAPEISDENLDKLVLFQEIAAVTVARDQDNPDVIRGKEIFQEINCSGCHVLTLKTGNSDIPELSNQEFHPFTDLLLHDMGPGLADGRAEFSAAGSEWRTTPLWGIGLTKDLATHKPGFLHDGRARTVEEAILWHGGEAKTSAKSFMRLKTEERAKLIKFLLSL
jgi:CxxC motif-containing protein (DUF1111 family)